jgi:hypothetical protein
MFAARTAMLTQPYRNDKPGRAAAAPMMAKPGHSGADARLPKIARLCYGTNREMFPHWGIV